MTLYAAALFLHVVGALLLFATLTLEGIALRQGPAWWPGCLSESSEPSTAFV
jgi:hypothetical protein